MTKEEFIKNQEKLFTDEQGIVRTMFMPKNGICWRCRKDIVPELISKGKDGKELVTGCPHCSKSFVD